MKVFDLKTLNHRKQNFNYGYKTYPSVEIPKNNLKKYKLKMTTKEMIKFTHFFPLIIGDLIPSNESVCCFFLNLNNRYFAV